MEHKINLTNHVTNQTPISTILEGSYVQFLINMTHKFGARSSNAACVIPS